MASNACSQAPGSVMAATQRPSRHRRSARVLASPRPQVTLRLVLALASSTLSMRRAPAGVQAIPRLPIRLATTIEGVLGGVQAAPTRVREPFRRRWSGGTAVLAGEVDQPLESNRHPAQGPAPFQARCRLHGSPQ